MCQRTPINWWVILGRVPLNQQLWLFWAWREREAHPNEITLRLENRRWVFHYAFSLHFLFSFFASQSLRGLFLLFWFFVYNSQFSKKRGKFWIYWTYMLRSILDNNVLFVCSFLVTRQDDDTDICSTSSKALLYSKSCANIRHLQYTYCTLLWWCLTSNHKKRCCKWRKWWFPVLAYIHVAFFVA